MSVVKEILVERHGWTVGQPTPTGAVFLYTPNGHRAFTYEQDGVFTLYFERADSDVVETLTGSTVIVTERVVDLLLHFDSGEIRFHPKDEL